MIRLNQQRLIRQRLPVRFLTVTLLVALLWFIVMFLYVDDLISEQTQGTRRHVTSRRRGVKDVHPGVAGDDPETLLVYDHDTGRRLEVERVEDEYVEVWEHGRWVRATSRGAPLTIVTPNTTTATSTATNTTRVQPDAMRSVKVLSPYSRIRKKPARNVNDVFQGRGNENNIRRDDDFILLDEDGVGAKESRVRELLSPVPAYITTTSRLVQGNMATVSPGEQRVIGAPRGSDDFHFAQTINNNNNNVNKAILPKTLTSVPKYHHLSPQVTRSKSSTIDRPLRFPPTAPLAGSTAAPLVRKVVKPSRRFSNAKITRLRPGALVEPRQLPLPQHSGGSRRSAPGVRRTKHRGPYRETPHVNINAKAGARINYVNVNKRSIAHNQYSINHNNINDNNNINHSIYNNKTRLKWSPIQELRQNATAPGFAAIRPSMPGRTMDSGVLYYSQSVRKVAARSVPSLDFDLDIKDGYHRHSFNVTASNAVPLIRALPDTRPKSCLLTSPPIATPVLPLATVVICFHNEAWSTLLRTLHSVLARSPEHLLKEIILVDDFSSYDYLGARLETYISRFPQIQLVRTHKREGLIRARLLGVSYARGDVLVFLDSHCECNRQWLEPLLHAITQDHNKIACPQIDIINPDSLRYEGAPPALHGGFNWRLQFVWKEVPQHQGAPHATGTQPIRTPTMIGGLFAVNRRYFLDIGAYDPGMDIWGGENLELSFRVWMCGGSIDILPCSRVGHLFRPIIPYGFPAGARTTLHHNAMRVAEVWMDQYSKFYYASQALPRDPAVLASLSDRHQLRRSLACHDFRWYLHNVVPEMDVPPLNGQYYGQLRNKNSQLCVHSLEGSLNKSLHMANCQQKLYQQQFAVTTRGEFVHYFQCVYIGGDIPTLRPCEKVALKWSVTKEGQVVASGSEKEAPLCLEIRGLFVVMATCDASKTSQLWSFTYRFDINKLNITY